MKERSEDIHATTICCITSLRQRWRAARSGSHTNQIKINLCEHSSLITYFFIRITPLSFSCCNFLAPMPFIIYSHTPPTLVGCMTFVHSFDSIFSIIISCKLHIYQHTPATWHNSAFAFGSRIICSAVPIPRYRISMGHLGRGAR